MTFENMLRATVSGSSVRFQQITQPNHFQRALKSPVQRKHMQQYDRTSPEGAECALYLESELDTNEMKAADIRDCTQLN